MHPNALLSNTIKIHVLSNCACFMPVLEIFGTKELWPKHLKIQLRTKRNHDGWYQVQRFLYLQILKRKVEKSEGHGKWFHFQGPKY